MRSCCKITCPYGKATFSQKYKWDRDVKNVHQEDEQVYVANDEDIMEAPQEVMERTSQESTTFQMSSWVNEEILNVSFTSETGEIFDIRIYLHIYLTPIYEVLDTFRPGNLESANINFEELQQQINDSILIEHYENVDYFNESIIK